MPQYGQRVRAAGPRRRSWAAAVSPPRRMFRLGERASTSGRTGSDRRADVDAPLAPPTVAARHGTPRRYVLRTVEERGVRFVRLWFVDVLGVLKSVAIPVVGARGRARGRRRDRRVGAGGRGAAARARRHRLSGRRDVRPAAVARRAPSGGCSARSASPAASRAPPTVARRARARARPRRRPRLDRPGRRRDRVLPLRRRRRRAERAATARRRRLLRPHPARRGLGLPPPDDRPPRAARHPGQGQPPRGRARASTRSSSTHTDALSMADSITTFRLAVKEVASELDLFATFMPKPLAEHAGSGMHLHLSLFDGDRNVFHDPDPDAPLSALGRQFLAGVLAHAPELTLLTNQWVNSYKRLAPGFEAPRRRRCGRAPAARGWCASRRRRPERERRRGSSCARPTRAPTRTWRSRWCSPPGCAGSSAATSSARGRRRGDGGAARCPPTCARRPTLFEASELARETLGDALVDLVVRNKRAEWDAYQRRSPPGSTGASCACSDMGEAWIYIEPADADDAAREASRLLAELGFAPRRVAANGSLRPERDGGGPPRPPDIALVLGEPGLCARLEARRGPRRRAARRGGRRRRARRRRDGPRGPRADRAAAAPGRAAGADRPGAAARARRARRRRRPGRHARGQPRHLPGGDRRAARRLHPHGVRAAQVPRHPPRPGVQPRGAAQPGLGLRLLRRRADRRRPRPPRPGQARRARGADQDGAQRRLPVRGEARR